MIKTLLTRPTILIALLSVTINIGLLFTNIHYKNKIESLSTTQSSLEQQLIRCSNDNTTWKHSYDNLMSSCQTQSEVIISLTNDLQNERKESGDVVREILLLSSEECSTQQPTNTGGLNEGDNPIRAAGLDDRLPDSLYNALQRSYNGSETPATPNP